MDLKLNGVPVVISVQLETQSSSGLWGSRYIATCHTLEDLNEIVNNLRKAETNDWHIKIDLQDNVDVLGYPCE